MLAEELSLGSGHKISQKLLVGKRAFKVPAGIGTLNIISIFLSSRRMFHEIWGLLEVVPEYSSQKEK